MGFPSKTKQSEIIHRKEVHSSRSKMFLLYFYDAFSLWVKSSDGSTEFYHFMKKDRHSWRVNNSSKTFSNQWEPMSFRKLQSKKKAGRKFRDDREIRNHRYITYELLSSESINSWAMPVTVPEQKREDNRDRKKIKGKNNNYHKNNSYHS